MLLVILGLVLAGLATILFKPVPGEPTPPPRRRSRDGTDYYDRIPVAPLPKPGEPL